MTSTIQKAICKYEVLKFNAVCENVKYLFSSWEYDVLSLNKGGNITEFEVKISRGDFLADKKKRKFKYYEKKTERLMPNRFYYVCPVNMIALDEIPRYAGLMYYENGQLEVIKKAPLIHKFKHDRGKIESKIIRLKCERMYLGSARMTYENNIIKKRNIK